MCGVWTGDVTDVDGGTDRCFTDILLLAGVGENEGVCCQTGVDMPGVRC